MAIKRMFSNHIVDTDAFLEMPATSQLLYFHLSMRADDEGFVGNPKRIVRMCGFNEDDIKVLVAKRFLLTFNSGVVVIKHWLIHNTIRMDRFNPTNYKEEKESLQIKENRAYTDSGNQLATSGCPKLSKVKLIKAKLDIPPKLEHVEKYCLERKNEVDTNKWYNFYESKGWMVGRNKMKDWKACVRTWESGSKKVDMSVLK